MHKNKSFEGAEIKYAMLLDLILPDNLLRNETSDMIMAAMDALYDMNDDERAEVKIQIERDLAVATKDLKLRLAESFRENLEQYSEEVGRLSANNEILNRLKPREKNSGSNGVDKDY